MATDPLTSHLHSATHEIDQAHQAAAAAAQIPAGAERGPEWLRALQHLHTARSDLADAEQLAALEARRYHAATWQQIADVYGVTKQAAQQRFTPRQVNEPLTARSYVAENKPSDDTAPEPDPQPLSRQQRRALERKQARDSGAS